MPIPVPSNSLDIDQHELVSMHMAALFARDPGLVRHSLNVAGYAVVLAERLGWTAEQRHSLALAGLLHDVGKARISTRILTKAGRLTSDEWSEMRRHVAYGIDMLRGVVGGDVLAWVAGHHERVDGCGYPRQLAAPRIALGGRILAVADSFDAMTSTRAYRSELTYPAALLELEHCAGSQFDSDVVAAARATFDNGLLVPGESRNQGGVQAIPASWLRHEFISAAAQGAFGGSFRLA